jgi:hypothetical protein
MARLFLKEPVVCIVKEGNCKKYYSNQIWARYKAPEMDDLDAHAGFGNYLSGANVLRTKVSRIVENLGASLASSPQIFDADLESLRSALENKKMELHNDLKGRTIALLGW